MGKRFGVVLAALALSAAAPGTALASGADHTGPNFTLQSSAHIVYPAPVLGEYPSPTPFSENLYQVQAVQKWSASDPSGICDYQLYQDGGRGDPSLVYEGKKTAYTFLMGDVDGQDGGYNWSAWALRVKDCAGNWSSNDSFYFPHDRYISQNGVRNSTVTHDDHEATYSGSWSTSSCTCFVDGTDMHATSAGASATFTYTGNVMGWVTETGPNRGSAKIFQDGVLKATVSTYSASNTGARVMWANWFSTAGTHTIRVVVVGTAGHPRVDVDGFLVGPDPDAS
jgi:hypothetical protein